MPSLTERLYRSVGRHFLTLSCVQRLGSGEEKLHVFSGFLVEIDSEWCFVTAGHVIRHIRLALQGGSTFDIWRFGDQTAAHRFTNGVPYDFNLDHWLVLEDESIGVDYAGVLVTGLYRAQLAAGGAQPLPREAWSNHVSDREHWALVGIPSETVTYDGETMISAKVVVAALEMTNEPEAAGAKAANQFYASLKPDSLEYVNDVDGMSGGPVFALRKLGATWSYVVIGVQSGWYRSTRVITACPFESFGRVLEAAVREARRIGSVEKEAGT